MIIFSPQYLFIKSQAQLQNILELYNLIPLPT